MAGSVNKVILVGNLGADPDIRTMQSGDKVANLSIATSERWKDRQSGERKEKTEWHRVVVFAQPLVTLAENYMKKGTKVYLEGQLETRSWEQDGQKKYITEIVLRPFKGEITMLDSRGEGGSSFQDNSAPSYDSAPQSFGGGSAAPAAAPAPVDEMEDEIPF